LHAPAKQKRGDFLRKKQVPIAASPASAVIYARFSSHNQKDESIEQQVAECKLYAKAN